MSDTRIVLVKPGDVLIIGNAPSIDHEEVAPLLTGLRQQLGLARIMLFSDDIDLAAVATADLRAGE
ncbi:hypothetical protein [Actinacidiphila sp. ITFR-21]|uniref:hypothetical protein n=1 Tax=Actinacidiphila sp. ITFR-21 TaxID=3075199 RepID=UPI00288930AA|nr:hypothetical protein [Streptomyces sp. ITFR-21]WNI16922.1 hypothetical protein RLT57_16260 [Streptomyces sp. ITFR-21]